ncbi:zinc finger protein 107 isoform X2 [Drosophila eugracilis]|uniref:zinc finger protein 107 isoform X2 n=1 Tax=Drosophila eugracilis TaxID=29029 RepID=UPI0007E8A8C3|nr:zinc finger protein 107 isoform X2 [Drosophila eugracilis]
METCGLIYVSGDYEKFLMRCNHCPTDLEVAQWQEFVQHVRNVHRKDMIIEQFIQNEDETEFLKSSAQSGMVEPAEKDKMVEESEEDANIEMEIRTIGSSNYATEESDASESSEHEEFDQEMERSKLTIEEANSKSPPTYKFHPSFFRRDPRTLKFIDIYKTHPCLWNTTHSEYKNPRTCEEAVKQMLADLEGKFNIVHKRVLSGKQKPQSLAFSVYTFCSFLKASSDEEDANKNEKIKLDFSKKNKVTTDLIEMYANFPQLYDSTHKEFSTMSSRKQAYESMAAEISIPNIDINSDDIFRAIQNLRQWYYKSTKHAINAGSEAEKFYLEVCRFMPPRMFKQRLVCEFCHQVTSSDHVLQSHIFKAHNIGELPFKCSLCDRSFVGRGELSNHIQRVHIGKTHKCTHCDRTFAVLSDLQLHIRTHTGHKPYVCEHCGKAFRLRSQMTLHVTAIHTKIRAFKCTMCPKDFVKKVDLSDHIKGHLNIRDKICGVCGKGFTSCHALIRHRQIHAEVKKFVCKLCDSRFSQFVGLNTHMKRTHNIVRNNSQKARDAVDAEPL